jgi:hypothetical protein
VRNSRGFVPAAWGIGWRGNGADSEPGGGLRVRWGRSKRPGIWASPKGSSPAPRSADRRPPPLRLSQRSRSRDPLRRSRIARDGTVVSPGRRSLRIGPPRALTRAGGWRSARVPLDSVHGRTLGAPEDGLAPIPVSNHSNRPRRKRGPASSRGEARKTDRLLRSE